ncbi:hypothetical protein [Streptomyces cinereoruber]|uniref:hypothetical protein n=1 Tax=Streptomyces cinereoruber TaxID=67260 RepID=UPI00364AA210
MSARLRGPGLMTLLVYRIGAGGERQDVRETVVDVPGGPYRPLPPLSTAWPPCRCPRCREEIGPS